MSAGTERLVVWTNPVPWRAESAHLRFGAAGALSASGTQLGVDPVPYRLDYETTTYKDGTTARTFVAVTGDGWSREVMLRRDRDGEWAVGTRYDGEPDDVDAPGCDPEILLGATDVDLGFSPLFNTLPVRRLAIHERPGTHDLVMAWISVPDLVVRRSAQRYEHVTPGVVRFSEADFAAFLTVGDGGIVDDYPEIAQRVGR